VRAIKHISDALIIVKTVIGLARNMNLTVIAEGVETKEHDAMLKELGCDLGQGYGIVKPMEAGELLMWNATRKAEMAAASTSSNMSVPTPAAMIAAKAAKAVW
jgi:EAL domain-containing protein (putative c-di-GMP-specific phosphodiesterase class I)